MGPLIAFKTSLFDASRERENPFNPGIVYGESILIWLRQKAHKLDSISDIEAEDHGWYFIATFEGQEYTFVGMFSGEEDNFEWNLVVDRSRSLKEKLLGKGKPSLEDPCYCYVKSLMDAEPGFEVVRVYV